MGELMWMGSVGQELHHLEKERAIQTDPEETRRRRTIQLHRQDADGGSWGFTLQTYGIRNKRTQEVEVMTYVDYVELHGPAWIAGMRRGDVFLSVNGESVEGLNHPKLVEKIQQSKTSLRLVVLFEDCCRKVELYERFIKLKRILSQKVRELKQLELEERTLCSGGRISRVGMFRDSVRSSTSSDWDCYSEVTSPGVLDAVTPNQRVWRQHFFARSVDTLDTASELSFDYPSPFGSSRESLGNSSRDSLTRKDSSDTAAAATEKGCEPSNSARNLSDAEGDDASSGAPEANAGSEAPQKTNAGSGAPKTDAGSRAPKAKYYIGEEEVGESDSEEVATLRRRNKGRNPGEPQPGCRARSNSTLLNDMRMILIADVVSAQACGVTATTQLLARGEGGQGDEGAGGPVNGDSDGGGVSDSEITVMVDEGNTPCRLYKGIRINDSDEVTRL
ncbi:uncharacterized protein LOC143280402 isoform X2 [Babylonia areolata]|uniref:uncharacterized protein LOC143280402 isoform X2 n=1 Tax=Babylonia areolata TaxID=304850 RepID=UPI003FD29E27